MKPSYGSEWDRGEHFWSDIFGLELTVMDDFDMQEEVNTVDFFIYQRMLLVMLKSLGMSQQGNYSKQRRGYENQMHNIHHTEACKSVTRNSFNKEVKT